MSSDVLFSASSPGRDKISRRGHTAEVGHGSNWLGCAMYMCLDLDASVDASLIWFEPNPHCKGEPWDDAFIPLGGSLEGWLSAWVAGGSLFGELLDQRE